MSENIANETPEEKLKKLEQELAAYKERTERLDKQNSYLLGMHEITLKLTSCHNLPELLREIVAHIASLLKTGHVYASLYNEETNELEIKTGSGLFHDLIGKTAKANQGLAGQVFQTGKLMFINNYQSWQGRNPDPSWNIVESIVIAPIKCGGKQVGIVGLVHEEKDKVIDNEEIEIINRFAESASLAFDNASIYEDSQRTTDELKALYDITVDLTGVLDTDVVLKMIIDRATDLSGAEHGYLYLMPEGSDHAVLRIGTGMFAPHIGATLDLGKGLVGKVWASGETVYIEDYQNWDQRLRGPDFDSIRAVVGIPLKLKGRVVGVLGLLHSDAKKKLRDSDITILNKLAELATISLNNSILFEAVRDLKSAVVETLEETIQAVAHTVEIRDPYTAGHQRRVALLSCAIARKMNLPEDQIKGIEMAATIHDIGKLYVPSELLSKPTRLMDIEFNVIRHHSQAGYDILKDIKFPWPIAKVVYQHHEKMNGTGYPCGLSGDEIIIEARIVSVADVVEAISSHRPYRPSLGFDVAIKEITAKKGIDFDPIVVDACIEVLKEGIQLEGWK